MKEDIKKLYIIGIKLSYKRLFIKSKMVNAKNVLIKKVYAAHIILINAILKVILKVLNTYERKEYKKIKHKH